MNIMDDFDDIKADVYYTGYIKKEFMVRVKDDCTLETIVYLPKTNRNDPHCEWPVLLTRTPYPQMRNHQEIHGEEFAKRGVAYVYQFCRGTGNSEGIFVPNVNERDDGIATLEWLVAQTWCGNVVLHGTSYMALTCWVVADRLPKKVVGMFVSHYGVDRYLSAYEAGLFRHDILTGWALANCGLKFDNIDDFMKTYLEAAKYRPHSSADRDIWGVSLPWYQKWISETDYDAEYWNVGFWQMLKEMPHRLNIPIVIIAGWFDHHLKGTLLAFNTLNENTKKKSRLIVGGWNHSFKTETGGHSDKNGIINLNKELFEWFMKINSNKVCEGEEIKYCIGDDRWYKTTRINTYKTKARVYYLCKQHKEGFNYLSDYISNNHEVITFKYDPLCPVMSIGGETLFVSENSRGCRQQPDIGVRDDVISFVSEPFSKDERINGVITAILKVETDVEDTSFAIKISDVFPDGTAYNIRNNITTLSYSNGATSRKQYTPGEVVSIEIKCLPILWCIKKNHSIRVDISSSNFPEYTIHSNTAGVWSEKKETIIANQKLYIGDADGCRLIVPIDEDFKIISQKE